MSDTSTGARFPTIPYRRIRRDDAAMVSAARQFLDTALERRSIRTFS